MKHDLNNIDYENFQEIVLSILNAHVPLKKKQLRANHASFVTKEFQKAIMKRARLRNVYLKKRIEATKAANNYQRNICVSLLRISKRSYFENLNVKLVRSNKKFSNDKKVAETFQEFLTNFVKSLNISQNPYL